MAEVRHVQASYDPDTRAWWAESDDVPGLVSEAPTLDALMDRVLAIAPELLSLNGISPEGVRLEFHTVRDLQAA